jgi:hypothetical protein
MAVWIYAFGKNGLGEYNPGKADEYLSIINSIELDEVKVLDRWSRSGMIGWMEKIASSTISN